MFAVIAKIGLAALGFLDKLFAFLNMQAAKKTGKDELKVEQAEARDVVRKKTKANNKAVDALPDDDVVVRLSKYTRK